MYEIINEYGWLINRHFPPCCLFDKLFIYLMIKVNDMNIIKTLPIVMLGILSSSFFVIDPTNDNPPRC